MFDGLHPRPDSVAVEDGDGTEHTWEHMLERAEQGARALAAQHPRGARVGMLLEAGGAWLTTLLAVWRAGCVAVPLSPRHPPRLREQLLEDAGADVVLGAASLPTSSTAPLPSPPESPELAMLLYTSGTTGKPKGAMLRHGNLAVGVAALVEAWQLVGRKALLHALPLHHMHGIAIALLPCITAGMRIVTMPRFDAATVWSRFAEIDTWMAVPTMYNRLLTHFEGGSDHDRSAWTRSASSLGLATSGSAALPQSLAARWQAIAGSIPLERWGMTEVGVGLSNPLDPNARRRGWVGSPIGTLETRVAADGELHVRGPSVCAGYWQRPDATEAAFTDGWFRTGDIVVRDGDDFRIVGRSSVDIIKTGGYKIGALEVEETFRDHEAIDDIAVVGLPDDDLGERVAAAIIIRPGAQVTQDALLAWARDHLAPYQLPRRIRIVDSLPRNAMGKVQKADVRTLFS